MLILSTKDEDFKEVQKKILMRNAYFDSDVESRVRRILSDIKDRRDKALLDYTRKFDGWNPKSPSALVMTEKELREAEKYVTKEDKKAIEVAIKRVEKYHRTTFPGNIIYKENGGRIQRVVLPIDRVGIYCPGGKAGYPSTVIMTGVPAIVAGVKEIYLATPAIQGKLNPYTIFTSKVLGINKIFKIGGAQAIGALAYGTETVPAVDKIVGPGNIYVATAKRLVQGTVGVDLIAGPSELVVVADGSVNPLIPAIDVIAQAEHDEQAFCVVICHLESYLVQVKSIIHILMKIMPRKEIIQQALRTNSFLIVTKNLEESIELANKIGAEHVSILTRNPMKISKMIKNAGTIYVGKNSPPAIGDYVAGPSHVLPTGGTARFASGLSVDDFIKKTNIIFFTKRRMLQIADYSIKLANIEGLYGHAFSVEKRFSSIKSIDYIIKIAETETTKNNKNRKQSIQK